MAIVTDAPAPLATSSSLLATLLSIRTAHSTRHALSLELESALSSYLTLPSSTPAEPTPDSAATPSPSSTPSTCLSESIRPPNEAELAEILRIAFEGLLAVRSEIQSARLVLRDTWARGDLEKVVGEVERLEEERLKEVSSWTTIWWECGFVRDLDTDPLVFFFSRWGLDQTIKRDQLRRLAFLDREADFEEAIDQADAKWVQLVLPFGELVTFGMVLNLCTLQTKGFGNAD